MNFFKLFYLIIACVVIFEFFMLQTVSGEELRPLEWSNPIQSGISRAELVEKLEKMDIKFFKETGGLTYSSKITTKQRDYLFCKDRLYAIVEGEFVTGKDFNKWFQAFLSAHKLYGPPEEYHAEPDWGRFRAEWKLKNGNVLHFQLQSDLKEKQGWSRQLYADDIGTTCLEKY